MNSVTLKLQQILIEQLPGKITDPKLNKESNVKK